MATLTKAQQAAAEAEATKAAEEAAATAAEGTEQTEGGEDEHTDENSGALVVNPAALLARGAEAEANSDRKPPMATWGQMNFLLYLTLRVVLGFTEEQANEARTRSGASGLISTLKADGVKMGIVKDN